MISNSSGLLLFILEYICNQWMMKALKDVQWPLLVTNVKFTFILRYLGFFLFFFVAYSFLVLPLAFWKHLSKCDFLIYWQVAATLFSHPNCKKKTYRFWLLETALILASFCVSFCTNLNDEIVLSILP